MVQDELSDAKLREAKRRANWTMPLEHYYPADPFGRFATQPQPSQRATGMVHAESAESRTYTVEPVSGGCHVIRPHFGGGGAGIRFRDR